MPDHKTPTQVAAPNEKIVGLPVCYFNHVYYRSGDYVCNGSGELLRCKDGIWLR